MKKLIKNNKEFDFAGYATKVNIKCSDGRVIRPEAFKHMDGKVVPLVWQHLHEDPTNVLGHALLEYRNGDIYAWGKFNGTEAGKGSKELVIHGDIESLSIFANQLKQQGDNVIHGIIREVSLVLAGANPGAKIDNIAFAHGDGSEDVSLTEAVMYSGELVHTEAEDNADTEKDPDLKHEGSGKTVKDVFDSMSDEQKDVVYAMLAKALNTDDNGVGHSEGGTEDMKKNVFDKEEDDQKTTLSHDDLKNIITEAQRCGSFKEAFLAHAQTYGIENIDFLFPDAKNVNGSPTFIKRPTEWVAGVINGVRHSPFSRIKSTAADITADEARARGYVKGALKKEEVIKLLKRVTTPTTVYKKQKLDRDDIIDITDLDVVTWLKAEMRMMLDEELARAILVGDGRAVDSEDKINEDNIRPIYKDDDMYSHKVTLGSSKTTVDIIEAVIRARVDYKGQGNPNFYTTTSQLTDMLLLKDTTGRRIYPTVNELANELRVKNIIEVPVLEGVHRETGAGPTLATHDLVGIIVNLNDYVAGADKGGAVSMFDDFDIDYNQYKYLIETRCSGALVEPKSALVIEKTRVAG